MTQWYYADHERNRQGPVSGHDLAQLHANGQLTPDTLVWREGLSQWQPWQALMAEVLAPAAAAEPAAGPSAVRNEYNPYAVAEPRPSYAAASADVRSPYAPPRATVDAGNDYVADGEVVYAGFWKRYAAYVIDTFMLSIVFGILGAVVGMNAENVLRDGFASFAVFYVIEVALIALYFGWMHASVNQATLGKLAVGIKVTDDDGQRISLARGIGRFFATIPSSLILGIGYIMAGFTDRKRALHDMLASTLVVDRWAYTSQPERQREQLGAVTIVVLVLSAILIVVYFAAFVVLIGALATLGGR